MAKSKKSRGKPPLPVKPRKKAAQKPSKPRKPKKPKQPIYIRLPGASRRYKNTKTGEILSRRQFEKKVRPPKPLHQILGADKAEKRNQAHREAQSRYMRLVEDYLRFSRTEDQAITKRGARNSSQFKKIIRDLKSNDPDKKAEALYAVGRIRKEEIAKYVHLFEKELGTVAVRMEWRVASKKTGAIAFEGSYRECVRWLAFGTRRLRFKLESEIVETEVEEEDDE